MEGDAPQVKDVSQAPQQPPVVPQTPPKPTPSKKPKKWLKFLIILIILVGLSAGGFFIWKNISAPEAEKEGALPAKEEGWFQTGNTQTITQFQVQQSLELEDNRMGDMVTLNPKIHTESPDYLANRINEKGLKWMRLSIDTFDWVEVENAGLYSERRIYPEQDRTITALAEKGISVMHTIVFWDEEIQANQEEGYSRFKTEEEIQRYLDYVQFIVHYFKGRIEYYEILNESNIGGSSQQYTDQQYVEVDDYINLVRRAVPIIRQEDPEAKIVAGGIAPLHRTEKTIYIDSAGREYLFGILESDVMPLVDAVSWHATGGTSPEYGEEHYYSYPALLQEIKDVASAHGFEGEYISEEMHWRTSETAHPHEYDGYSETTAAKYLARAIVLHLGMDITAGLAECLECQPKMNVIQVLSTLMAGAKPIDLPTEIQSEATNIRSYTFSLSNGDKLIALWADGVAVDDDPGVRANLTVQDTTSEDVTATNVLNGYQQSIITTSEDGDLVIQDLIVKDYPLILHIGK